MLQYGITDGSFTFTHDLMEISCASAEVRNELSKLLQRFQDPEVQFDPIQKRGVISKVIGYMTMGVDTSCLFPHLTLACETTDFVTKKLVYLYLSNHAEKNPEVALLCINTLIKECKEQSPIVRGLALRSLSSLRLPQLFEYLFPVLKTAFTDPSPYVRKTACTSALRVFRASPAEFRRHQFLNNVLKALQDSDALVCGNALAVLLEVSREAEANGCTEGILHVTKPLLYQLLNIMKRVSEYHRVQIISLIHKYVPQDESEMYDIMNLLDEHLQTRNSGTVLSVCKALFHLTQNHPAMYSEVLSRLKAPLLTLVSSCTGTEAVYPVLCHIKLLLQHEPRLFQDAYKSFYCRSGDPTYTKTVKMDILSMLVTPTSVGDILNEFVAYAHERGSSAVSCAAIEAIGRIPLKLPAMVEDVTKHLVTFLESSAEYVRNTSITVMKGVLQNRRYIPTVQLFLEKLMESCREMDVVEPESSVALVWLLGEYGEHIEEAPYILEEMCNDSLLKRPAEFLRQFLTSSITLFFKRPPEMQRVLGRMFQLLANDFTHPDVHDQVRLYYRLLRENPEVASYVICAPKSDIIEFAEERNAELKDKLFDEFNTLSVVYFRPSEEFVRDSAPRTGDDDDDKTEDEEQEDDPTHDEDGNKTTHEGIACHNVSTLPNVSHPHLESNFSLSVDASMELHEFEHRWISLGDSVVTTANMQLRLRSVPDMEMFEDALDVCGVVMLTAGPHNDGDRCFLYAQEEGAMGAYFLLEVCLSRNGMVNVKVKSDSAHMQQFLQYFNKIMDQF